MKKTNKTLKIAIITVIVFAIIAVLGVIFLEKFSIPDKEDRIEYMKMFSDTSELSSNDVAREIHLALSWPTNWDNLFLSSNFKAKYKNRRGIIDDSDIAPDIWCGADSSYGVEDTIIVYVNHRRKLFEKDDSNNTSTMYVFKYILDDNGEIDELIRIEKQLVYTINGEPVE